MKRTSLFTTPAYILLAVCMAWYVQELFAPSSSMHNPSNGVINFSSRAGSMAFMCLLLISSALLLFHLWGAVFRSRDPYHYLLPYTALLVLLALFAGYFSEALRMQVSLSRSEILVREGSRQASMRWEEIETMSRKAGLLMISGDGRTIKLPITLIPRRDQALLMSLVSRRAGLTLHSTRDKGAEIWLR